MLKVSDVPVDRLMDHNVSIEKFGRLQQNDNEVQSYQEKADTVIMRGMWDSSTPDRQSGVREVSLSDFGEISLSHPGTGRSIILPSLRKFLGRSMSVRDRVQILRDLHETSIYMVQDNLFTALYNLSQNRDPESYRGDANTYVCPFYFRRSGMASPLNQYTTFTSPDGGPRVANINMVVLRAPHVYADPFWREIALRLIAIHEFTHSIIGRGYTMKRVVNTMDGIKEIDTNEGQSVTGKKFSMDAVNEITSIQAMHNYLNNILDFDDPEDFFIACHLMESTLRLNIRSFVCYEDHTEDDKIDLSMQFASDTFDINDNGELILHVIDSIFVRETTLPHGKFKKSGENCISCPIHPDITMTEQRRYTTSLPYTLDNEYFTKFTDGLWDRSAFVRMSNSIPGFYTHKDYSYPTDAFRRRLQAIGIDVTDNLPISLTTSDGDRVWDVPCIVGAKVPSLSISDLDVSDIMRGIVDGNAVIDAIKDMPLTNTIGLIKWGYAPIGTAFVNDFTGTDAINEALLWRKLAINV